MKLIRLYGDERLEVCKHIALNNVRVCTEPEDQHCEYTSEINIFCKECNKEYVFLSLIN